MINTMLKDAIKRNSLEDFDKILKLDKSNINAHRGKANWYFKNKMYFQGWNEYMWLSGKIGLDPGEMGKGSIIQFMRFAPRFPNAVLLSDIDLFETPIGDKIDCDYVIPLRLLPCLAHETHIVGFPYAGPKKAFTPKVKEDSFNIGIGWQGNKDHYNDKERSIPVHCFEPLSKIDGVNLYNLQKDIVPPFKAKTYGGLDSTSFCDTAGLIQKLDLVITSDTSFAHLAGAMDVPTWVVLNYDPDWRWFIPNLYPSVAQFKQDRPGNWEGVFDKFVKHLKELHINAKNG